MKIFAIAAAATLAMVGASGASAQMHARTTTVERSSSSWHNDGDRHGRWGWKTRCTTNWRHGHKVHTCRKVRVRW